MKILDEVTPSPWEERRVQKKVNKFLAQLDKSLKGVEIELGGSFAKETWLKGNHDIDIFIKFPLTKRNLDLSKALEKQLSSFNFTRIHGSRDYFQIRKGRYTFELIPVYNITGAKQARNITDVSPLHTLWVKENNKEPGQIRMVKKFVKAQNLYGAESHIKGFSGYVLEILTSHYKTFFDLVKNAANWKPLQIIDTQNYYSSKDKAIKAINKSKLSSLLIIDPVQKDRNASAALSEENFKKFVEICQNFIKNPSEEYFKEATINMSALKSKAEGNILAIMQVNPLEGKNDVVGSKILKVLTYINSKLISEGFSVLEFDWRWKSKAILWFIIKDETLSKLKRHYGPPVKEEKHLEQFKRKWQDYELLQDNHRYYIELDREHRTANSFIKSLMEDGYIKYNVKKIKLKLY